MKSGPLQPKRCSERRDHSIYLPSISREYLRRNTVLMLKADANFANKYEEHSFLVMLVGRDSFRTALVASGRANNRSETPSAVFPRACAKLQQAHPNGCVAGTCQHDRH
jgi:hypothetical protein